MMLPKEGFVAVANGGRGDAEGAGVPPDASSEEVEGGAPASAPAIPEDAASIEALAKAKAEFAAMMEAEGVNVA